MDYTDHLTNEQLKKKFKSQFELVSYAIKLAENMIRTGRAARIKSESQNPAMLTLGEIEEGVDRFDEIPKEVVQSYEAINERTYDTRNDVKAEVAPKASERKRARKILVD